MSVFRRKDLDGWWCYRRVVVLPDGRKVRIRGKAPINTKGAAEVAERAHVERVLNPKPAKGSTPTLTEWFDGRFWQEWVIGEGNRAGTRAEKRSVFDHQIKPSLGHVRLEDIDQAAIQRFKAELAARKGRAGKPLSAKTRSNVLAVLSKTLRYAEEVGVIDAAPKLKPGKFQRPEIIAWEFEDYVRIVASAAREGDEWHAATLLAGESGLRIGEILALTWERDIDLVAGTMTISRSIYRGQEGPTKGGRARKVPMTSALLAALLALPTIRRCRVVRSPGGDDVSEGLVKGHRAYRSAGWPDSPSEAGTSCATRSRPTRPSWGSTRGGCRRGSGMRRSRKRCATCTTPSFTGGRRRTTCWRRAQLWLTPTSASWRC